LLTSQFDPADVSHLALWTSLEIFPMWLLALSIAPGSTGTPTPFAISDGLMLGFRAAAFDITSFTFEHSLEELWMGWL